MQHRLFWSKVPPSRIVLSGLLGIFAGLIWARFGVATSVWLVVGSFGLTALVVHRRWPALFVALLIGLQIGLWRGHQTFVALNRYEQLYGSEVYLRGVVSDDAAYADRGQTEFHISNVSLQGGDKSEQLAGRIRVRSFTATGVRRGDTVAVTGKIYPSLGNRQGGMSFASVEIVSRKRSFVEDIRAKFFAGVYTAIPEPNASLGLGFLVGLRTLLPDQLLNQLSITGLTHIVAVSGYNLTILVRITRRLFERKSVFISLVSSVSLIVGFLLVTGLSPSISRAAVVSGFALASWYYGRRIKPSMLILLGAVATGLANPFYIWLDLGWWLSFAAFFGVLVIAPLFTRRFFKTRPRLIGQIVIETTAAQIMALPIIAVVFGELSLISIMANVIILPLIPLAMLLTFIAGLAGMVSPLFSGWFAWPATILLTFMTDVIAVLARVPWALAEVDIDWLAAAAFYAAVLFIIVVLYARTKPSLSGTEVIE